MTDYFLKAAAEQAFWDTLILAGVAQENTLDGATYKSATNGNSLDVIGMIYEPTGNMLSDPEIGPYPEMVAIPGYHANLRGTLTEEQITALGGMLIAAPTTPVRVWA